MTTKLSPAAQSILDAYRDADIDDAVTAAAVLRAAAEELHYKEQLGWTGYGYYTDFQNQILAIAAELEAQ